MAAIHYNLPVLINIKFCMTNRRVSRQHHVPSCSSQPVSFLQRIKLQDIFFTAATIVQCVTIPGIYSLPDVP
jgi:hypothetical protein